MIISNGWRMLSSAEPRGRTESTSSSSRMRVIYHNWSATKQRPHPQSVAEISRHSVLSGDRIRQCETSSGSRHKDTDQCLSRLQETNSLWKGIPIGDGSRKK